MSKGVRAAMAAGLVVLSAVAWTTTGGAQSSSAAPSASVIAGGEVQDLRERAAAFWAARLAGDYKGQWELLEPRGRGRLTPQEYAAERGNILFVAYQVEDATVNGYFATVKVRVLFQPVLPIPRRIPVQALVTDDRWIRVGGVWYHRLDDEGPSQSQGRQP